MNRHCHGRHFNVEGANYYRCSYDGTVSAGVPNGSPCPTCGREVDGDDHGALEVSTEVKRYVVFADGRQAILSASTS